MKKRRTLGGGTGQVLAAAVAAASIATGVALLPSAEERSEASDAEGLPLGVGTLAESRLAREIAEGVTHVSIRRGEASADDVWTVTVGLGTTEREVAALERKVRAAGYTPYRDETAGPDPLDGGDGPLGRLVRVGRYQDRAEADRVKRAMAARGLTGTVEHTSEDGRATTGPWVVNVLVVDPARFHGSVRSELAGGIVPVRERTSTTARRAGALAAVNGGFFVQAGERTTPGPWLAGTDGDPAGVAVIGGVVVSEAVNGRPALVLPDGSGRGAAVRRVGTRIRVTAAGGASREVTGLNRQAGLVVNCGGVGDATPFRHPAHDYTCGNGNEVVAITSAFGASAPRGSGYQVTLDGEGRVTAVQDGRGGAVPVEGTVLQGTGTGAEWLRTHAGTGAVLTLSTELLDTEADVRLPLTSTTSVVNGGPLLLRDGAEAVDDVRDGWSPEDIDGEDRALPYNSWFLQRAPRTAAGVTADGRIVLVTADGRKPDHSIGLTIAETAAVMRSLGAVDALNLDGGGSTAMVVGGRLQGLPSDRTGERAGAEALLVMPAA